MNEHNHNEHNVAVATRPGVRIGDNGFPEIVLSDGRVVNFTRKLKVKDSEFANNQGGRNDNVIRKQAALMSRIVTVDGRAVKLEEILEWDYEDFTLVGDNVPGNS